MQPSSLGGLLQKAPFWCCFPSPSMQPAGAERLRPVGGWGGNTDALQSSACPPGDQLLQLLSRQHGWDERGRSSKGGGTWRAGQGARQQELLSRAVKLFCKTGR